MINLKQFEISAYVPEFSGVLGRKDSQDELVAEYGMRWRKTPNPTTFFVINKAGNVQVTISVADGRDNASFIIHREANLAEFKKKFDNLTLPNGKVYFFNPVYKYIGLHLAKILKEEGVL